MEMVLRGTIPVMDVSGRRRMPARSAKRKKRIGMLQGVLRMICVNA